MFLSCQDNCKALTISMIYLFKGSGSKGDEGGRGVWDDVWLRFSICGSEPESELHEKINTFDQKYASISLLGAGLISRALMPGTGAKRRAAEKSNQSPSRKVSCTEQRAE